LLRDIKKIWSYLNININIKKTMKKIKPKYSKINIGSGADVKKGWVNLDITNEFGAEVIYDLRKLYSGGQLPFKDNSFDYVLCKHVIHTFIDPTPIIIELVRICKPKGKIEIKTHLPTGNNSSIRMIRGHTIGMMKGFVEENFGSYYFKEFSKGKDIGKINLEKAEYYTNSNKKIQKMIIWFSNRLGWKVFEKSPLMYVFPWISVKIIYKKL